MHRSTKLATCCYCGTRAALVLNEGRHELVCVACGAPLHKLKSLPVHHDREPAALPPGNRGRKPDHAACKPPRPRKAPKRRKSRTRWFLEEAFDLIEDILD